MKTKKIHIVLILGVLLLIQNLSFGQGLCDANNRPAGSVEGAFEIDGNISSGCSPLAINLKDKSGGTDIRYDFYYDGSKDANLLDKVGNKDSSNAALFSNANSIRVYKILQYGSKSGKPMFACRSISVAPTPQISYTVCNEMLGIEIPSQTLISNTKFVYNLGTAAYIELNSSDLPYTNTPKNETFPVTLNYFLKDNAGLKICEHTITIQKPAVNATNNNPYFAKINKLEMKASNLVNLSFTGAYTKDGYELFMMGKNDPFPLNSIKKNISPGVHEITLPDSVNSYCFFLSRTEICGGTERSADICTIPLQPITASPKENTLDWASHKTNFYDIPTLPSNFGHRNLISILKIQEIGGPNTTINLSNSQETYIDLINCKKDYCYQINTITEGELFFYPFKAESISLKRCISRKDLNPPNIKDLELTVNANQKIEIHFKDDSNWNLQKEKFILYKNTGNAYKNLDSSNIIKTFTDQNVDVNTNEYCYKIGYIDECGSTSLLSPEVCNIKLNYNDSDELDWNSTIPFGNTSLINYELIGVDEKTNLPYSVNLFSNSEFKFELDLSNFETEAKFYLKGIGANGKESLSNLITIPIEAIFFVPDIFTPDSDNINDSLSVKGRFGRVAKMQLSIYNRWGEKIYELNNKNESWDGKTNGKSSPEGVYFYKLNIELNNQENIQKQGQFTLLR